MMHRVSAVVVSVLAGGFAVLAQETSPPATQAAGTAEAEFVALRDAYVARYRPLYIAARTADWAANVSGADADFERKKAAERALIDLHSDKVVFGRLQALRAGGQVRDPVLKRELDVMYRSFLPGQADPALRTRIAILEADVEQIFNTHRSKVGERELTENEVRAVLATSRDPAAAETAWKAYMQVGAKADAKLRELVRLRNELARQLGFEDYFKLSLMLQEVDEAALLRLFDELDELTRGPFAALKAELDGARAKHFGIAVSDLRPWHFGDLFFQEAPPDPDGTLDAAYEGADLVALARAYYGCLGLPCEDILARSDLYEKPGKCPHAFSTDLDRAGDVRILCNMKPNLYWADTILHELGHAVYDQEIRPDVPFLLHDAAHGITTEGIAILFGAQSKNGAWVARALQLEPAQAERVAAAARRTLRSERLMFSRWAQVMVRFEQGMYGRPDQDLGKLWWDLKQRYQLLNPPEDVSRPDYAAKTHILTTPVYYHSYMLGDLFAAQLRHHLGTQVLKVADWREASFWDQQAAGAYLKAQVFGPGNLYAWNELIERATGAPLTARYFAEEIK